MDVKSSFRTPKPAGAEDESGAGRAPGGTKRHKKVIGVLLVAIIVMGGVAGFMVWEFLLREEMVQVDGLGQEVDTSCTWNQYRANPRHDGLAPSGTRIPKELHANWKSAELNTEYYSASKSSPAVDTDLVYIGADTGKLHALSRADGSQVWEFQSHKDESPGIHSAPAFDDENVYVGCYDGWLYCLDKTTGELNWETDMSDPVSVNLFGRAHRYEFYIGSSPILYGDVVYIGVEMSRPGGALVGCDRDTGEVVFVSDLLGSHPHSTPSVDPSRGYIFLGSNDDHLYCYDIETQDRVWKYRMDDDRDEDLDGDIKSTPCIAGDVVLITGWDHKLHAIDIETGETVWKYETGDLVMSSPSVWMDEGLVYTGSHDHYVHCVGLETGKRVWRYKTDGTILSSPTLIPGSGVLLIGSRDDHMYQLDLKTGDEVNKYLFESDITSVPVATGNAVYLFTNEGYMYEMS